MNEPADKALLPTGLSDILPPEAESEVQVVERLMASFAARGYERVKPPLIEFEESFLAGDGAAMANETFRLMDPVSQRMMVLRSDLTLQVARIATTRLKGAPRPLRLAYAGQVLRVKGPQIRPARQFGQVGVELIGSSSPAADAEIILLGVAALKALGIENVSVDLGLPTLVPAVAAALGMEADAAARLRTALDRKDAAAVAAMGEHLGTDAAELLASMLKAAGPADKSLAALAGLDLPTEAAAEQTALVDVIERVKTGAPDLELTVDPVENRGFEYHTGVTFTFFALDVRGELGCGGRYLAGNASAGAEAATGLTFFTGTVLSAAPSPPPGHRIFLPLDTPMADAEHLRDEGWVTVAALEPTSDSRDEARRMGCTHVCAEGVAVDVGDGSGS